MPGKPDPGTPQVRGGVYSHGATGGGLKDTLEPHFPVTNPDIARCLQLYEPLLRWNAEYEIEPSVAESVTPNADNTQWTIRLRDGVEFHNGKTVTAEDVMFSLARVTDPKKTGSGGTELATILELNNSKIVDPRTILLQLNSPYAVLDQLLAEYTVGIIPTDFDVENPVGTGPFALRSLRARPAVASSPATRTTGTARRGSTSCSSTTSPTTPPRSTRCSPGRCRASTTCRTTWPARSSSRAPRRWSPRPGPGCRSPCGSTSAPFSDVRVRQALRLVVDRQQMIDQALNGFGVLGNDMYSPFDPAYAKDLPQRMQDIDQAKSLLQAGRPVRTCDVELVTSSAVGAGAVESANLFVEQAKAGRHRRCRLNKADANTFYGDRYLSWNFAQDFWNTRNYIPQVAACAVKGATYNETHFDDPTFNALIDQAKREPDPAKRTQFLHDAQEIEYNTGGFIIWGFKRQLDAYSNLVQGLAPHRYLPCSCFGFKHASFVPQT